MGVCCGKPNNYSNQRQPLRGDGTPYGQQPGHAGYQNNQIPPGQLQYSDQQYQQYNNNNNYQGSTGNGTNWGGGTIGTSNNQASSTYGGVVSRGDQNQIQYVAPPAGQRSSSNGNSGSKSNLHINMNQIYNNNNNSGGYVLDPNTLSASGGLTPEEKRRRAAEAAEARAKQNDTRGGISEPKAKELNEAGVKEDLIGRIEAQCKMKRIDAPIGLRIASVDQLRDTLSRLQNQS